MSAHFQQLIKKTSDDLMNSMKFDDVDLYYDSFAKPGARNPMSSPSKQAVKEFDFQSKNDKSKSTMAESSEGHLDPFLGQPALMQQMIPSKRKSVVTETLKTSQFKESSVVQKKNACNWDIDGSFKSQMQKRQRLDSAFQNATLEKNNLQESKIKIPVESPPQEQRQYRTLSFNEQSEVNLFKLAAKKTNGKSISHPFLGLFQESIKRKDHSRFIRNFLKGRLPNLSNVHPCPRVVFQSQRLTQIRQRTMSQIQKLPQDSFPKFSSYLPRQDFKFKKRHAKILVKANILTEQETRRAQWRKQGEVFFRLRCFSKKRNPVAVALRLAKSFLDNERNQQINHNKVVDHLCPQERPFGIKALSEDEAREILDTEKERFEYEVLRDKNEFQDLLNFYFERKMTCADVQQEKWIEFYQAKNQDITPRLELIERQSYECLNSLTQSNKGLKKLFTSQTLDKLVSHLQSVRRQIHYIKNEAPARVFGDYIGDKMIGIIQIPAFNIMLNEKIKRLQLRTRKQKEKGWLKLLDSYTDRIFLAQLKVHQLEVLVKALQNPDNLKRVNECRFFLEEILLPEDLLDACIKIASGDFSIESLIRIPGLKDHQAHIAFKKIMKLKDLSRFVLDADGYELNVSVPKERIKNFIIKLDQFKIKKRKTSVTENMQRTQKETKSGTKSSIESNLTEKLDSVQTKLQRYNINQTKKRQIKDKDKNQRQKEKQVIISIGSKPIKQQSNLEFLTFEDEDL